MAKDEKIINKALAEKPTKKTVSKGKNNYRVDKARATRSTVKAPNTKIKKPSKALTDQVKYQVNMRTKAGRKKEYMRLRRNYSSYKSRMKKQGIMLPEMPDLVKEPLSADIHEMARFIHTVKEVYRDKGAREYKAVAEKINQLIIEGLNAAGNEFAQYKAQRVLELTDDQISYAEYTEDYSVMRTWKKRLPSIEKVVEQFIFSSTESDNEMAGHSTACWHSLCKAILGDWSKDTVLQFFMNYRATHKADEFSWQNFENKE